MIFTVIASFILAALSGMGVGGGGLFVVFLALFSDLPQITVQGINLLFFIFSAGAALLVHLSRRRIFGTAVLTMIIFGLLGSLIGSALTGVLPSHLLRRLFGILLVATGALGIGKNKK